VETQATPMRTEPRPVRIAVEDFVSRSEGRSRMKGRTLSSRVIRRRFHSSTNRRITMPVNRRHLISPRLRRTRRYFSEIYAYYTVTLSAFIRCYNQILFKKSFIRYFFLFGSMRHWGLNPLPPKNVRGVRICFDCLNMTFIQNCCLLTLQGSYHQG